MKCSSFLPGEGLFLLLCKKTEGVRTGWCLGFTRYFIIFNVLKKRVMRKKKIHDKPELRTFRRRLRSNATPAEAFLWKHLQRSQLEGRKFRRQHSIHNYIVDFYCPSEGLIIELDGQVHMNPKAEEYDRKRDTFLENMGFIVLRYENKMVFDFLPSVLKDIRDHFKENRK